MNSDQLEKIGKAGIVAFAAGNQLGKSLLISDYIKCLWGLEETFEAKAEIGNLLLGAKCKLSEFDIFLNALESIYSQLSTQDHLIKIIVEERVKPAIETILKLRGFEGVEVSSTNDFQDSGTISIHSANEVLCVDKLKYKLAFIDEEPEDFDVKNLRHFHNQKPKYKANGKPKRRWF